ncbi:MAG: hypothetical protein KME23_24475 [Goleter apudmare HA4340-LM2]|jgi:hypothetical protein|nr:hypothetical protein [Goleter apudmare HA4340-LM2]
MLNLFSIPAIAEITKGEDLFDRPMSWAAGGWPLNTTIDIRDSLVDAALGKVVIDRHGEDPLGSFFKSPFVAPSPGRFVIISLWGSKIEGCFVKTIFQYSPADGQADLKALVPVRLELGIGGQILQLTPTQTSKPRGFQQNYTYSQSSGSSSYKRSSTWYMTESLFAVNSNAANLLSSATPAVMRARLTFADGDSKIFLIGENTVKNWQTAYAFNAACKEPN